MIEDEGRDWPTSLMQSWLGQKVEGHATMVAAPKDGSRRHHRTGTRVDPRLTWHINNCKSWMTIITL
jgi:hypothetical protein